MSMPQYDQFEASPKIATAAFADCGKLLGAVPPEVLYHYTTPAGLLGIISSGEIFLSDAAFLNDSSEIIYARHLVSTILAEHASAETDPAKAALLTYAAYDIQLERAAGNMGDNQTGQIGYTLLLAAGVCTMPISRTENASRRASATGSVARTRCVAATNSASIT